MSKIDKLLDEHTDRMQSLDDRIIGEVIGVAQAAGDLRKALDELDAQLDVRKFEQASQLGYRDIASAFIFLQRTLAGLQSAEDDRAAFTSNMAGQVGCAYEDIDKDVKARMQCYRSRSELDKDDVD